MRNGINSNPDTAAEGAMDAVPAASRTSRQGRLFRKYLLLLLTLVSGALLSVPRAVAGGTSATTS